MATFRECEPDWTNLEPFYTEFDAFCFFICLNEFNSYY
jgi:hypothetical protein